MAALKGSGDILHRPAILGSLFLIATNVWKRLLQPIWHLNVTRISGGPFSNLTPLKGSEGRPILKSPKWLRSFFQAFANLTSLKTFPGNSCNSLQFCRYLGAHSFALQLNSSCCYYLKGVGHEIYSNILTKIYNSESK